MLNTVFYGMLTLFAFILVLFTMPVRVHIRGRILIVESILIGEAGIFIGYKKRGLGFMLIPEYRIFVGPYSKPYFSFRMKNGLKKNYKLKIDAVTLSKSYQHMKLYPNQQLSKSIFSSMNLEKISINGKLGLSNPYYTGMIYGFINAVTNLPLAKYLSMNIIPRFSNKLDTDLVGKMHFRFSPVVATIKVGMTYLNFKK